MMMHACIIVICVPYLIIVAMPIIIYGDSCYYYMYCSRAQIIRFKIAPITSFSGHFAVILCSPVIIAGNQAGIMELDDSLNYTFLQVCMYVCMYACMYVCIRVSSYRLSIRSPLCSYMCIFFNVYACIIILYVLV
jgi:hypothetical protein